MKGRVVILPVQAVAEDVFILTVVDHGALWTFLFF